MKYFIFLILLILTGTMIFGGKLLYEMVVLKPGDHLALENIKKNILTESTIYFRDGKHKIGAFYDRAHRVYLSVPSPVSINSAISETIPQLFIKAVVASEDKEFYDHVGISPMGIFRATIANIRAGRVVQGGSTLTMQTSELLFEHQPTTKAERWRQKFLETLDAFRLESHYSKEQILEFYCNLFHVHGTGAGLYIAARYYFDKEVQFLNLEEMAFIAGSVKGPANYNPFLTKSETKKEKIIKKATDRRNYVLNNMLEMGYISKEEHDLAAKENVKFQRGAFGFEQSTLVDAVKAEMESTEVQNKLKEYGITDISRAEIKIFTTLDHELQQQAEFHIKRNLSNLEFRIKDYLVPEKVPLSENIHPQQFEFVVGTIKQVNKSPYSVKVTVGKDEGVIQGASWEDFVRKVVRKPMDKLSEAQHAIAAKKLVVGQPILVSTIRQNGQLWDLGVEQLPQLNGGLLMLQEGEIRAMVGGFENAGFNRALNGKRQPGSTFKLLIYTAALQMGWNPLEPLINEPRLYTFQSQYYLPRPDHIPESNTASMVWAGAKSENLASVNLLEHLTAHLSIDQFESLMNFLGLTKGFTESNFKYITRIRDSLGIFDKEIFLHSGVFEAARLKIKASFALDSRSDEAMSLDRLYFAENWESLISEETEIQTSLENVDEEVLKHNYHRLLNVKNAAVIPLYQLANIFNSNDEDALRNINEDLLRGFYAQPTKASVSKPAPIAYALNPADIKPEWTPLTPNNLLLYSKIWEGDLKRKFLDLDNVWIEGKIRVAVFQQLEDMMKILLQETLKEAPYSIKRLYYHKDFRIMLGLQTLLKLGKVFGVRNELQPILSFPLGSNEVSLDEVALLYQTYNTGVIHYRQGKDAINQWKLIDRIEDLKGNVIYEDKMESKKVIPDETLVILREIMRSVVEYGTGKGAKPMLQLTDYDNLGKGFIHVPGYGKTGTANNYSNATFAGFIPKIDGIRTNFNGGYTIAAYAGMDRFDPDAKPFPFKLTGSLGGLPPWAATANFLINSKDYKSSIRWNEWKEQIPPLSDSFLLDYKLEFEHKLSMSTGMPIAEEDAEHKAAVIYLPYKDALMTREATLFQEMR